MTPAEQRNKLVEQLANTVADIAETSTTRFDAVERSVASLREEIGNERTRRDQLAQEQRAYVDACDIEIFEQFYRFRSKGFWARLNWLVRGR